jgi:hypothetical protein
MPLQQLFRFLARSRKNAARTALPASDTTSAGALPPEPQPPVFDRLALQTAVIQHLEWCVLFNDHLSVDEQQAQQLPPLPGADDSELGRWLEQVRQRLSSGDHRLVALIEENKRFHQLARQALDLARQDRMDLASTLLNTDFERSRARVLELLRQLQKTGA